MFLRLCYEQSNHFYLGECDDINMMVHNTHLINKSIMIKTIIFEVRHKQKKVNVVFVVNQLICSKLKNFIIIPMSLKILDSAFFV